MIEPDTILTIARMAQDFCAILLWGGMGFLAFLAPTQLSFQLSGKLRSGSSALALVAFAATVAILPIQAARLGDGWPDGFNSNVLYDVLLQSSIGWGWIVQLIAATLLLAAVIGFQQRMGLVAVLAAFLLASRTLSGHAAMLDGAWGIFLRLSYLTHTLAAGAWVGALVPVILIMRHMSKKVTEPQKRALQNFSTVGHFAVAVTILSGLANALLIRGRLLPSLADSYDATLIVKIALVAAMISIAIINRYAIVPRISASGREAKILGALTAAEFTLAVLVLIIVNFLSAMNPH